jgi:hypothetical protein
MANCECPHLVSHLTCIATFWHEYTHRTCNCTCGVCICTYTKLSSWELSISIPQQLPNPKGWTLCRKSIVGCTLAPDPCARDCPCLYAPVQSPCPQSACPDAYSRTWVHVPCAYASANPYACYGTLIIFPQSRALIKRCLHLSEIC